MNNHSFAFDTVKAAYQDWKMMTEDVVKSLVPYSITQTECDEILGINQKPAANQNENTQAPSPATN